MRRVVVTGLGLVTPLACGVEETWSRILDGKSGAGPITRFNPERVTTKYAMQVPLGDGTDGTFNSDDWMEPKERRKVDDFILYGIAAAVQAVKDAGWEPEDEESRLRTGVMIGSGIGHNGTVEASAYACAKSGLWMLTRVLAQELWDYNISVNELIPGPVLTQQTGATTKSAGSVFSIDSEWVKTPEDVAPLALFMATQPDRGPTAQSYSLMRRGN